MENKIEISKYLDKKDVIARWPKKKTEKIKILEYLGSKFDNEKIYTEKGVNEIIKKWHSFGDHILLRRELYDNFVLNRTRDGREYWKEKK